MGIAADITTLLRAQTAITGAVTGKTVGVYAGAAPQRDQNNEIVTPPHVVVTKINQDFHNTLEADAVSTNVRQAVLDIDCKGVTEPEAGTVEDAVAAFLDDYTGGAGDSTIDAIDLSDSGDDVENPEHGEGLPVFVKTLEAEVIYS